jgi:Na+/proline symporter
VDVAGVAQRLSGEFYGLSFSWRELTLADTEFFLLGALALAWVSKGLLLCFGGPEQLYDFQRFLSAKDEKEASKLGLLWGALHTLRWPMAMAIAVLFLSGFGGVTDQEQVLPAVIKSYLPAGVRGLVLAALLAAFMSTFNSLVNAGASYVVVDVYQRFLRPGASPRQLVRAGALSSFLLIALGLAIGARASSIHKVFQWIMAALGAGVLLPNFLRWYWWRLNGWGFTAGILAGIAASLVQAVWFDTVALYVYFPVMAAIGLVASVLVSFLTPPTEDRILMEFYRTVQPAGLWGPVRRKVEAADPTFRKEPFGPVLLNLALGIPWLFALWVFPMYLVGRQMVQAGIYFSIALVLSGILYFTWYLPLKRQA